MTFAKNKKKNKIVLFSAQLPKQWYCLGANSVCCFLTFDILEYIAYIKTP